MNSNPAKITTQVNKKGISLLLIVLLLMLYSGNRTYSQSDKIEELKAKAEQSDMTSDKVDALNALAWEYRLTDPEKAYDYGRQAGEWARDLDYNIGAAQSYINIGYIFLITKNDLNKAMKCLRKANRIAENMDINDKKTKTIYAKITEGVGLVNYKMHDYQVAIENYEEAAKLYTQSGQGYNVSNCYHSLSQIYDKIGDKKKAAQYSKRELANTKRTDTKAASPRKNSPKLELEDSMVKIDDMDIIDE